MRRLPVQFLTWVWIWRVSLSAHPPPPEEVEILRLTKESTWTSNSKNEFVNFRMRLGGMDQRVLQACANPHRRSVLSEWTERGDAKHLYLDMTFAQEQETSGQPVPLKVYLLDSAFPYTQTSERWNVLDLNVSRQFTPDTRPNELHLFFSNHTALYLGPVRQTGFQLGLSYTGMCVLVSSIKVYYRRCPDMVLALSSFSGAAGGSGPVSGSCVSGAVEEGGPLERNCSVEGVWGPQRGQCACGPGHQLVSDSCHACGIGFYRQTNQSGGCRKCPPHSETHRVGSDKCECVRGFSRLPSDPHDLGCAQPPSAPVNVTAHQHNDSVLFLTWDPPLDGGGRPEMSYLVQCETRGQNGGQWKTCDGVRFPLDLTSTSVNLTGMNPYQDYRLSVQARNNISILQGAPFSSIATVTINRLFMEFVWTVDLLSSSVRPLATAVQAGGESVLQLLEGLGGSLVSSLKEVLVERRQLTLGKELGKGEFGSVYEAVFVQEDGVTIEVAVKTMKVGFRTQDNLHMFLREAEIMKNFNHDNVVQLLGVTLQREEDSPVPVPLVILPYMKHGDLRRFLIATRYGDLPMFVPYQTLLRFMVNIAEGMDYLSSQGFLHRDLAARNCMLSDDLKVRVADFGLSRKIYDNNYYRQKEASRVPIKWMAIESLSESVYTTKSDVWSFGITMWEIVSRGRTPYPGVQNRELLDLLLTGHRLKAPGDCDPKLWEVMFNCWEMQPTQRPGFRELCDRLKALLSELPALEACQEATYLNQGLEAAAAVADCLTPRSDSGDGTKENVYLPAPVGPAAAPPPREKEMEPEDGYLKYLTGSESK
ncbi:tyrosine-protein kinase receptor TYRO3 [Eucyclogobius newberryi]|uniref:tyrosine-protein kinase receptor TYRO3 n=1 Tax=Eucyclogobius newberryi TaxID=166745 RepID=UPI003B5CE9DE